MNDKYVKLADVKRKLRYIFNAYGVNGFVKEKIKRALNDLPYSVKGDLETTLEAADVQPVKHGRWENTSTPNQLKCSNCEIIHLIVQYPQGDIKYCPNCGARMDGDKAERTGRSEANGTETCVCCGAEIPEGRQVCPVCENREDK